MCRLINHNSFHLPPKLKSMNLKDNYKVARFGFEKVKLACHTGLRKMRLKSNFMFVFILSFLLCAAIPSVSQDAAGTATGTVKDLGIDTVAASKDSTMNAVVSAVNTIGNADGHNK